MQNPIIASYLKDESIPIEKRQMLAAKLDQGQADPKIVAIELNKKYNGKYDPPSTSSGPTSDPWKIQPGNVIGAGAGSQIGSQPPPQPPPSAPVPTQEKKVTAHPDMMHAGQHTTEYKPEPEKPDVSMLKNNPEFMDAFSKMTSTQKAEVEKAIESGVNPNLLLSGIKNNMNLEAKKEMSVPERLQNTALKTIDAVKGGQEQVGVGTEEIKGANDRLNMAYETIKDAKQRFESGKLDKATYEKLINKSQEIIQESADTTNVGISNIVGGATRSTFAPGEGIVTGGFEPEMNKVMEYAAEKIGDSDKASDFVQKINKLAEEHPAMKNYLLAGLELTGTHGGTKLVKDIGEGTVDSVKKTAPIITEAVNKVGTNPTVQNTVQGLKEAGNDLYNKLDYTLGKNMAPEKYIEPIRVEPKVVIPEVKVDPKKWEKAMKLVTPQLNVKNFKEAASQGLAGRSTKKFWKSTPPDSIELNNRMISATKTMVSKIPNFDKFDDVQLPKLIEREIAKIGQEIRPAFKEVKVADDLKNKIENTWQEVKAAQIEDPDFMLSGIETMQKTFENKVLTKLKQVWTDTDGAPKDMNLEDLWNVVSGYDGLVKPSIKNAADVPGNEIKIAQQQAWLQNRQILRDMIDSIAETIDDVDAKKGFKEMSDLYAAKDAILSSIKPNKGKEGVIKNIGKELIMKALPLGALGYGLNEATNNK